MNRILKFLITFPIVLISCFLVIAGAFGLGYSFVTVVLNHNYIEKEAFIVEKVNDNAQKSVELEYKIGEEIYNGTFPFIESKVGTKIVIGYNPDDPTHFHLGDQNSHFAIFVWGLFFEMLGIMIITLNHKMKN